MVDLISLMAEEKAATPLEEGEKARSYTSSFLTKRWPLFTIDPVLIYIQGPLPLDLFSEKTAIDSAFSLAKVMPKGRNIVKYKEIVEEVKENARGYLYQDRERHRAFLMRLAEVGMPVQIEKVASRSTLLNLLESYINERDAWLKANGYASIEDYQAAKVKPSLTSPLTPDQITQAMQDL